MLPPKDHRFIAQQISKNHNQYRNGVQGAQIANTKTHIPIFHSVSLE